MKVIALIVSLGIIFGCSSEVEIVKPDLCPMPDGTDLPAVVETARTTLTRCPDKLEEVFVALLNVGKNSPKPENSDIIFNALNPLAENNIISERDMQGLWEKCFTLNFSHPLFLTRIAGGKRTFYKREKVWENELAFKKLAMVDCCGDNKKYEKAEAIFERLMELKNNSFLIHMEMEDESPVNVIEKISDKWDKDRPFDITTGIREAINHAANIIDGINSYLSAAPQEKWRDILEMYRLTCKNSQEDQGCQQLAEDIRREFFILMREMRYRVNNLEQTVSMSSTLLEEAIKSIIDKQSYDSMEVLQVNKKIELPPGNQKMHAIAEIISNPDMLKDPSFVEFAVNIHADLIRFEKFLGEIERRLEFHLMISKEEIQETFQKFYCLLTELICYDAYFLKPPFSSCDDPRCAEPII